jgi:hypothetical protein
VSEQEDQGPSSSSGPSSAKVARDAALQSLVSNAVYLAIMLGFTVAIANRDWIGRQVIRLQRWTAGRQAAEDAAVAELRADISRIEHYQGGDPG